MLFATPWSFVTAIKQESTTIPIVIGGTWEPVPSFARPEGNVTGVAWLGLLPKQMELLKEIVPNLKRVGLIRINIPPWPPEAIKVGNELLRTAASTLGLIWKLFPVAAVSDYDEIFAGLAAERVDAAYIVSDALSNQLLNLTRIGELALRYQIPTVSESAGLARGGPLLAYGQDGIWTAAHRCAR